MDPLVLHRTATVKRLAGEAGFDHCGIARAEKLDDDARRLEEWLNKGMHGTMSFMERHFDLRTDPRLLVPGARSVVTLMMNHFPAETQRPHAPRVARYAYGKDYHEVIRTKLNALLDALRREVGHIEGRGFVDSAPVLERSWAQRSGLGWVGRNGNLIHKGAGSYFFLATLITDMQLVADDPFAKDYCGTCRRCIDACPTDAILPDRVVDGSRCISHFTIELKDMLIPEEMKGRFGDWMFGCDVCQEVCPWNRFSTPTTEKEFTPLPEILNFSTGEWESMTEEAFREVFRESPLRRSKHAGIMRNLRFISEGRGDVE